MSSSDGRSALCSSWKASSSCRPGPAWTAGLSSVADLRGHRDPGSCRMESRIWRGQWDHTHSLLMGPSPHDCWGDASCPLPLAGSYFLSPAPGREGRDSRGGSSSDSGKNSDFLTCLSLPGMGWKIRLPG